MCIHINGKIAISHSLRQAHLFSAYWAKQPNNSAHHSPPSAPSPAHSPQPPSPVPHRATAAARSELNRTQGLGLRPAVAGGRLAALHGGGAGPRQAGAEPEGPRAGGQAAGCRRPGARRAAAGRRVPRAAGRRSSDAARIGRLGAAAGLQRARQHKGGKACSSQQAAGSRRHPPGSPSVGKLQFLIFQSHIPILLTAY
jgi:hypothetical protein